MRADDQIDSRYPIAPFLSGVLLFAALLLLVPDMQWFTYFSTVIVHWLPWAGLAIAFFGIVTTSTAGRRALPFLVLATIFLVIYLIKHPPVEVRDLRNSFATAALTGSFLIFINHPHRNSSNVRAVLVARRRILARGVVPRLKVSVFLGHVYLDLTQSSVEERSANVCASITAGTMTISLPAEWRLVLLGSPATSILTEQGVPRDIASSPVCEIALRGMLAWVEVLRT